MNVINQLLTQWNVYWQIPMFRIVLGVLLLAGGIIYLQLTDARLSLGFLAAAIGLFCLFHGVSAKNVLGLGSKPAKPAAVPAPRPKPVWKIELASPTAR